MPSLKHTKRRIVSVKSTQKITRAMKLVSSAKFARANHVLAKAQRSFSSFAEMTQNFLLSCSDDERTQILARRAEKKTLVIVLSTDRGLCGGLNTNLFKLCNNFLREKKTSGVHVDLALWGRKAAIFGKVTKYKVFDRIEKVLDRPSYAFCKKQAAALAGLIKSGEYDRIFIAYASFKNAMTQQPVMTELLPVKIESTSKGEAPLLSAKGLIVEPEKMAIADDLFSTYLANHLLRILLEASLSEHASRMSAMDSATNNADKVIKKLTLEYNRARQASITKELIEITSGAEAL